MAELGGRSHERDHEKERLVARETAKRLEREVEDTARRVERIVEETAKRLEKGVEVALHAVAATALVHAEAHSQEHVAHERIHAVEKTQVDKAEVLMNKRLETMNEFRAALADAQGAFMTREVFEDKHEQWGVRLTALERQMDIQGGKKEGISDTARIAYAITIALASVLSVAAIIIGFAR